MDDPVHQRHVNVNRQKSAFPPNFIHSLDSTHMLMTALGCTQGVSPPLVFASVHDSYWTHAATVDAMNTVIRDQFVALHSQPIMENLRTEFTERYADHVVFDRQIEDADLADIPGVQRPARDGQEAVRCARLLLAALFVYRCLLSNADLRKKKTVAASAGWRKVQIAPVPPRGAFDVSEVRNSDYFFD